MFEFKFYHIFTVGTFGHSFFLGMPLTHPGLSTFVAVAAHAIILNSGVKDSPELQVHGMLESIWIFSMKLREHMQN